MAVLFIFENERLMRRERVFRDINEDLEVMTDLQLIERYRFPRHTIFEICGMVENDVYTMKLMNMWQDDCKYEIKIKKRSPNICVSCGWRSKKMREDKPKNMSLMKINVEIFYVHVYYATIEDMICWCCPHAVPSPIQHLYLFTRIWRCH